MTWFRRMAAWGARLLSRAAGEHPQVRRTIRYEASPLATEVSLTLDRPRKLRFTMAEASEFRRRTGISVWTGEGTEDGTGLNIAALNETQLLELLTVTCLADDPGVTPGMLGPHIAGEKLLDVVAALMVLVADFLPDVSEEVLENPLVASALLQLMSESTGRSRRKPSGSAMRSSGGSHPA
jgi:hypothetical protein